MGLGVEGAVGDGDGVAVGDGTVWMRVGVGVCSGWQANRNDAVVRASMKIVAIVRTGLVRSVELCSFKNPSGEVAIEDARQVYHAVIASGVYGVG